MKKTMLPCEIVEMNGNNASDCDEKDDKYSLTQWKFKMPIVEKPSKMCFRKWKKIVGWLRNQEVVKKRILGHIASANGKCQVIE